MQFPYGLQILGIIAALQATAADWPRFLGATLDSISPETGLIERVPEKGLPVVFDLETGTGYAPPSLVGNQLFLFHRLGTEEILEAWETPSAKLLWKHTQPTRYRDPYGYNDGPRCAPLIAEDRVITFGAEGLLTCVDKTTGRRLWQRDTAKDFKVPEAFFGVGSGPLLESGRLLVMVGGQPDSTVVAFDLKEGRTLWESVGSKNWTGRPMLGWPGDRTVAWQEWDKTASYASLIPAVMKGQRVVHALTRQGLVVLNPTNGAVHFSRWFRAQVNESVNATTPLVFGEDVLISSAYYRAGSVLLRPHSSLSQFTEVWKGTGLEMHWSQPIKFGGHLYGFSGRNEPDALFRCVDYATGKIAWERIERWAPHSSEQPPVFGRGSLLLADGRLFALGEGGLLGLFRPTAEQCEELGRWQVPSLKFPCWAGPVLSDGRLYIKSERRLVCLDVRKAK